MGECDGALPNASGSSGQFQQLVGVRVWPSVWVFISGFESCRSLNLVAIDMKLVVVNWNSGYIHTVQVQRPMQENRDTNELAVATSYPWWVRDLFICHQQIPLQTWGHFLPRKRYSPAFLNHQIGNLRDGCELPQLHTAKSDLWDSATSFWAHPGMPENVTNTGMLNGLVGSPKSWFILCAQFAPKDCSPCHYNTGSKGCRVVSYLVNSQATKAD